MSTEKPRMRGNTPRTLIALLGGFALGVLTLGLILIIYRTEILRPVFADRQNAQRSSEPRHPARKPSELDINPTLSKTDRPSLNSAVTKVAPIKSITSSEALPPDSPIDSSSANEDLSQEVVPAVRVADVIALPQHSGIVGSIMLRGEPRPETPLPIATDPFCSKLQLAPKTTRFYLVDAEGGLADVFVYLTAPQFTKSYKSSRDPLILDQSGCFFSPYVAGLQVGQTLVVRNSDSVLHNVHIVPLPESLNKESNRVQPAGSADLEFRFEHPDIFLRVKCDVHPWMFAYIGVVEHPFFAITAADGTFSINEVPAGSYTLQAVHRKVGTLAKEVSVGADAPTRIDFTFELN